MQLSYYAIFKFNLDNNSSRPLVPIPLLVCSLYVYFKYTLTPGITNYTYKALQVNIWKRWLHWLRKGSICCHTVLYLKLLYFKLVFSNHLTCQLVANTTKYVGTVCLVFCKSYFSWYVNIFTLWSSGSPYFW